MLKSVGINATAATRIMLINETKKSFVLIFFIHKHPFALNVYSSESYMFFANFSTANIEIALYFALN